MSLRSFTVFQDDAPSKDTQPKVSRPTAMTTRSATRNILSAKSATAAGESAPLDKENYNPLTGERAGPSTAAKKRKTAVLSAKPLPPVKSKKEQEGHSEPEKKKRKPSASGVTKPTVSSASKTKVKKDVKGSGSLKKSSNNRTGSSKVSPLPKLAEVEEAEKEQSTQADIDSRCYDLTVKPLADVSQAYEESSIFDGFANAVAGGSEEKVKFDKVKFGTAKASSVEPEIRDYFQPSQALFCPPAASRLRAFSEQPSAPRTFSTPERKQIYAAFTFCSPTSLTSKASRSGTISPSEGL
ncbi:hypothetical protein JR316_0009201 [Psilocybe cubensis]|uniref:Uncharacterized protein n=2 Tax=Psilocybe cubensis TaxID=181762 RepID=A0A8H7XWJ2_PSICU|nr:hypothetical protein JR316_0009201 [Psilocybe cubensis]KAH9478741.1 hypothetical protein JR316_0009201 [Psilocybe cubensis]